MSTLIIGASEHPHRYSHLAALQLLAAGEDILMLGKQQGEVKGHPIYTALPADHPKVDTITLYVNPTHQENYRDLIFSLKPRRVIFNPGTENLPLMQALEAVGVEAFPACTLVMLSTGQF
jgi:predicted CoA-binding protein